MNLSKILAAIKRGLAPLYQPPPMSLNDFANNYFYLSGESSHGESNWVSYPYQRGLLNLMGDDDIQRLVVIKAARMGYTKALLAWLHYNAVHKKRSTALYQPVDQDANQFVATELMPVIRDCPTWQEVFPEWRLSQHPHNKLDQKIYRGSVGYIKSGKSPKNYRRITVSGVALDEYSGFDRNIGGTKNGGGEGNAATLSWKRTEGATYRKQIIGSTVTVAGEDPTEIEYDACEIKLKYHIRCPNCGGYHPLVFGGKDEEIGFKWEFDEDDYPCDVKHIHDCGHGITQSEFLELSEKGRWQSADGIWYNHDDLRFYDPEGNVTRKYTTVGIQMWTGISPQVAWPDLVQEFLAAKRDPNSLRTFVNTTLGECYIEDRQNTVSVHAIMDRPRFNYKVLPNSIRAITIGTDTQDDRLEGTIVGWGMDEEAYIIDHIRLYGDLSKPGIWEKWEEQVLKRTYEREDGAIFEFDLNCHDYGGHFGKSVAEFSKRVGVRKLIPVFGASMYGGPLVKFPRKKNKDGIYLTQLGTDQLKTLLHYRFNIEEDGGGKIHLSDSPNLDEAYVRGLVASEKVKTRYVNGNRRDQWEKVGQNEPFDCMVYATAAVRISQLYFGLKLGSSINPVKRRAERKKAPSTSPGLSGGFGW